MAANLQKKVVVPPIAVAVVMGILWYVLGGQSLEAFKQGERETYEKAQKTIVVLEAALETGELSEEASKAMKESIVYIGEIRDAAKTILETLGDPVDEPVTTDTNDEDDAEKPDDAKPDEPEEPAKPEEEKPEEPVTEEEKPEEPVTEEEKPAAEGEGG